MNSSMMGVDLLLLILKVQFSFKKKTSYSSLKTQFSLFVKMWQICFINMLPVLFNNCILCGMEC